MAKAKNNSRPQRQGEANLARELAEQAWAEWVKSNPDLVGQLKRAAEYIKQLSSPSEAERARHAELVAARKEMGHYTAIRDNQIPPPWAAVTKSKSKSSSSSVTEAAVTKEALTQQRIQTLYGRHPYEIPKRELKTGTIRARVNKGLDPSERYSWETFNRALGRDKRRK